MLELHLDDFDAYKIARSGQCFRMRVQPDGSVFAVAGAHAVALRPLEGGVWRFSCERQMFDSFWRSYFDLDADYARYRARAYRKDGFLQQAFLEGAGLRILRQDAWETLVSFIISQRKSIPAISTAVEALCRACGQPVQEEPGVYAFPSAQTLAQKDEAFLRACGLGYRAPYVLDAAKRVASAGWTLRRSAKKRRPRCALRCSRCTAWARGGAVCGVVRLPQAGGVPCGRVDAPRAGHAVRRRDADALPRVRGRFAAVPVLPRPQPPPALSAPRAKRRIAAAGSPAQGAATASSPRGTAPSRSRRRGNGAK